MNASQNQTPSNQSNKGEGFQKNQPQKGNKPAANEQASRNEQSNQSNTGPSNKSF